MDEKRLETIRARVEKATPGPWIHMDGDVFYGEIRDVDNFDLIAEVPEADDRPEDFEFMAEARQDIPDLLAEVERLRSALSRIGWIIDHDFPIITDDLLTKDDFRDARFEMSAILGKALGESRQ